MKKKNKLKTRSRILRKVLETEPGWRVNVIVSDREFLGSLAELNPTQCTQICIIYRRLITYIIFFPASLPCTDILTLASKCLRDRTKIKGKKETHPSNPIFPGIMISFSFFFLSIFQNRRKCCFAVFKLYVAMISKIGPFKFKS